MATKELENSIFTFFRPSKIFGVTITSQNVKKFFLYILYNLLGKFAFVAILCILTSYKCVTII